MILNCKKYYGGWHTVAVFIIIAQKYFRPNYAYLKVCF